MRNGTYILLATRKISVRLGMYYARGWRNVEKRPTLAIFFSWIWLTPLLPNIVCFPSSNVFFSMFFHHKNLIFLDSCTDTLYPFDHKLIRSKSSLKVFCAQIFMQRNIHGKITQSGKFCDFHCYPLVLLSTTANTVTTVTQTHLELHESHPKFLWVRQ